MKSNYVIKNNIIAVEIDILKGWSVTINEVYLMSLSEYESYCNLCKSNKQNEQENNTMDADVRNNRNNVVTLWNNKMNDKLKNEMDVKVEELLSKDIIQSKIKTVEQDMSAFIKDKFGDTCNIECFCGFTRNNIKIGNAVSKYSLVCKETGEKINEIETHYNNKMNKIDEIAKEVKTLIAVCDTYEQVNEILFAYCIVDNNGKLYV